jgi:hypothetical protein
VVALDEELWIVVHTVRLRGVVELAAVDDAAVGRLVELGVAALAARGVRLTPAGRDAHTRWARLEPGSDAEAAVRRAYERFLPLNRELIRVCHDWQVRPGGAPNDHADRRYDWAVVDRLHTIDDRIRPIVRRVAPVHPRFDGYLAELHAALERVDAGAPEWLTSPRCDSYHTVWMRFHEDLLLALGADRSSEATSCE